MNKREREDRGKEKRGGIGVYHDTFVSGVQPEQAHARTEQRLLKVYLDDCFRLMVRLVKLMSPFPAHSHENS